MKYFDEKVNRYRLTLDHFLLPNEKSHEDVIHSGDKCRHVWKRCVHQSADATGSRSVCKVVSPYYFYSHYICAVCGKGKERFLNRWGEIATTTLKARREKIEKGENIV